LQLGNCAMQHSPMEAKEVVFPTSSNQRRHYPKRAAILRQAVLTPMKKKDNLDNSRTLPDLCLK
ncbi:unnamed protein product, partial [Ceratitis capitata]